MAQQLVFQGTLNRILVAVSVISFPSLNVTAGYFGTRLATLTFEGDSSDYIGTLTGATPSPRPYQQVTVAMFLNRSQPLAQQWENQRKSNTTIGDVNVVTDSTVLGAYYLYNCTFMNVPELLLTGESNDFPITIRGTYPINSQLFGD
jgi:hypothetical protein